MALFKGLTTRVRLMTRFIGSNWLWLLSVTHTYFLLLFLSLALSLHVCVTAQGGNLLWAISD